VSRFDGLLRDGDHRERASALATLRRRATLHAVVAVTLTLAGYGLLWWVIPETASRWLAVAGVVLGAELFLLRRHLDTNRRHDADRLLPTLGAGNLVTLTRGVLLAWVAGFLAVPWVASEVAWLPALGYGLSALLDAVDGAVARARDRVTVLGETLDVEFDALGLLVVPLVGVVAGQLPAWYIAVGLARYLFVGGCRLREFRGLAVHDLPPRSSRRVLAGAQMLFVAVALTPVVSPGVAGVGALLVGVPLLLGFVRDWLYVSGRLSADESA
jgi:CDP-diacylglycerol--glycerol-3-phosphate 3-phosphatidyltransferase